MLLKVPQKRKPNTLNKKIYELMHIKKRGLFLSSLISYIVKNMNGLLARVHPGFLLHSYSITKNVKFNKMSMGLTPLVSCSKN
jgi:hypothetical protein